MEYTKLKVTSKDDAKRFYRVLAIKDNPDLYTLGAIIGESINAWFEHIYYFKKKGISYVPDIWMDDFSWGEQCSMGETHLSDLGDSFIYEYDTGEGYDFSCKVLKTKINYELDEDEDEYPIAFVVEGKGQGIFENDHNTLWKYLDGEIDPLSNEEDEDLMQFLPMNMDFETYGDFDAPLDLDNMIYYDWDLEDIVAHFRDDYDVVEDDEMDESDEQDLAFDLILKEVAYRIFNDDFTNRVFRRLTKNHDMDEAYEIILTSMIDSINACGDNDDPRQVNEYINKQFDKLK